MIKQIFSFVSRLWARQHNLKFAKNAEEIGEGGHDCALVALHNIMPNLSQETIKEAFMHCTENWPYAGITNKEFNITMKYLKLNFEYDASEGQTVQKLRKQKAKQCVALIYGHYIAIDNGRIIGWDNTIYGKSKTEVYCSWIFSPSNAVSIGTKSIYFR